jgi:hypothetical protein
MLFFHMVARFMGQVNFMHDNTVNRENVKTEELLKVLTLNAEA